MSYPEYLLDPWSHDSDYECRIRAGASGPELDWRTKPDGEWVFGEEPSLETHMAASQLVRISEEFARAQEHAQIDDMRIGDLEAEREQLRTQVSSARELLAAALSRLARELPPGRESGELAALCENIRGELASSSDCIPAPSITIEVEPGRVVLNDLWLIVDRPEVKIISGDTRTKNAEVFGYCGSDTGCKEIFIGLTERSVHAGEEGPEWTTVKVHGLPPTNHDDSRGFWRVEAQFLRYELIIWCWLEGGRPARQAELLWERAGLREATDEQ